MLVLSVLVFACVIVVVALRCGCLLLVLICLRMLCFVVDSLCVLRLMLFACVLF